RAVNTREKLALVLRRDFPWCEQEAEPIRSIFRQYVDRKRAQNVLDYDDLLLYWSALMQAPAGERWRASSITSWSTNTRTRTRCRATSWIGWHAAPGTSQWSGTTPRPSTRFGARRFGTSSSSRSASPARRW